MWFINNNNNNVANRANAGDIEMLGGWINSFIKKYLQNVIAPEITNWVFHISIYLNR